MADLNEQIGQILSDPQQMAQLQSMAAALGLGGGSPQAAAPVPAPAAQSPGLELLTQAAPLLSGLDREDDATRLLQALRPLLGEARRQRLDEALRLLRVMRLLPALRQLGGSL